MKIAFLSFLALVFLSSTLCSASDFCLRVYTGMNYLKAGDLNDNAEARVGMLGTYDPIHRAMTVGGDFIVMLNPSVGIGIGSGYHAAAGKSTGSSSWHVYSLEQEVFAAPVRTSFFLFAPLAPQLGIVAHAGAGYYFASAGLEEKMHITIAPAEGHEDSLDVRGGGIGFHGGMGLELLITPSIGLLLEVNGRLASLSGLSGDARKTYIDENEGILIYDSKPKDYKVDFSGYSLVLGLSIHFK